MIPKEIQVLLEKNLFPMSPLPVAGINDRSADYSDIKAIFIDLFGTLMISGTGDGDITTVRENHYPVTRILSEMGCTLNSSHFDDRITELLGRKISDQISDSSAYAEADILMAWRETINHLSEDRLISWDFSSMDIKKMALAYELTVNPVWPMPGALPFLEKIKNHFTLGTIVNGQFYTPWIFEYLFHHNLSFFGFQEGLVFMSYETGQVKPSPILYASVMEKMSREYGINPEQVLVVGNDYTNDILPAKNAGFKTALFCGDSRSFRRSSNPSENPDLPAADCVFSAFDALLNYLLPTEGKP
jgi:putative hydrolase of the HAD superfamily